MPVELAWFGLVLLFAFIVAARLNASPTANARNAARLRIEKYRITQVIVFATMAALLLIPYVPGRLPKLFIASATVVAILIESFVMRYLRRHRFRRQLLDCDHRLCPRCFYSLVGLPDPGRCPECGYEFTHAGLVEEWERVYKAHIFRK